MENRRVDIIAEYPKGLTRYARSNAGYIYVDRKCWDVVVKEETREQFISFGRDTSFAVRIGSPPPPSARQSTLLNACAFSPAARKGAKHATTLPPPIPSQHRYVLGPKKNYKTHTHASTTHTPGPCVTPNMPPSALLNVAFLQSPHAWSSSP